MSEDNDWLALHAFYAANANPMLTGCVRPLVDGLRADGLIDRWFFIRYWLEGPHVRLRFLPAAGVDPELVASRARDAVTQFLTRRPALYEEDRNDSGDLYRNLFVAEYGEAQFVEQYGEGGAMPFRDNNSIDRFPYERELDRYGGRYAMELAEEHFEFSSDEILQTIATTSVHLRTILLGQAAMQTLLLAFAVLGSPSAVSRFLQRYRTMWEVAYQEPSDTQHADFDRSFERMEGRFVARVAHIADLVGDDTVPATSVERRWAQHGAQLRDRVAALHTAGRLSFRDGATPDLDASLAIILSSWVHMSNNRLGASILDEIYLSYVTVKALDAMSARRAVA